MSESIRENAERWQSALATVFPKGVPRSANWQSARAIAETLNCCCGVGLNYTMIPVSGGMNIKAARVGSAPQYVELVLDARGAYICKAESLIFEHFPEAPWESFFLLEAAPLQPSGVHSANNDFYEEVVELPTGKLVHPRVLDHGTIARDEHGEDIPLPSDARRVQRYFRGKFLIVSQFSWWNSVSNHADGRQDKLSASEIRDVIEAHLDRKKS